MKYNQENITSVETDDFNKFLDIVFDNEKTLRILYTDLPFDIKDKDDNFELTNKEFDTILKSGVWEN